MYVVNIFETVTLYVKLLRNSITETIKPVPI